MGTGDDNTCNGTYAVWVAFIITDYDIYLFNYLSIETFTPLHPII